ncbi:MAG: glutamate-5-semialdehyde dehydrogenase [Clostridia bacterium]|nr:glutamate-5-semialdehyde dehydrogenase [Clostridia bacterium]
MFNLDLLCKNSKIASRSLINVNDVTINNVLIYSAKLLKDNREIIKKENEKDVINAKQNGKSASFIDRLLLTDKVIDSIAEGFIQVSKLVAPLNKEVYSFYNEFQEISVKKITVPFGVIGIIFEARPNVTADAFALCFKTKNAVILRGGSDAINSNMAIVNVIKSALKEYGIDENAVSLITDTSRDVAKEFMKMNKYLDLLIPRGGASLIKTTLQESTIPVIETGTGNCHVFVDEFANIDMAVNVIFNAKTQRYSVCNALESIVIHSKILENALPKIEEKLLEKEVEIFADERAIKYLKNKLPATEEDFYTEYGCAKISVKVVDSIEEAIVHINEHSTGHSESIITENKENAEKFLNEIDSSCVYHNASTRFSDGFVFGLGAEIGISTQKLHARGPMGLEALVTTKYVVKGDGAVRK